MLASVCLWLELVDVGALDSAELGMSTRTVRGANHESHAKDNTKAEMNFLKKKKENRCKKE